MEPLRWEGNRTETGPSEYNPVYYRVKSRMSSPPKNTASRTLSCPLPRLSLTHSEQRITLASDHVNSYGREQRVTSQRHQGESVQASSHLHSLPWNESNVLSQVKPCPWSQMPSV